MFCWNPAIYNHFVLQRESNVLQVCLLLWTQRWRHPQWFFTEKQTLGWDGSEPYCCHSLLHWITYLFIFLRIKVLQLKTNLKLDWIIWELLSSSSASEPLKDSAASSKGLAKRGISKAYKCADCYCVFKLCSLPFALLRRLIWPSTVYEVRPSKVDKTEKNVA